MSNANLINWVLRVAVAGEFIGHGVFALRGKEDWLKWFPTFGISDSDVAVRLLFLIGLMDLAVALVVLLRPVRAVLLWAVFWGFWTALVRPLTGGSGWDFVERWANWGAPLALLLLIGWPRRWQDWLK